MTAETLAPGPLSPAGVQEASPTAAKEAAISPTGQPNKPDPAASALAATPTPPDAPGPAPAPAQTPMNAAQAASPVSSLPPPDSPFDARQAIPHADAAQATAHGVPPMLQHASAPAQIAPALVSLASGRAGASQLTVRLDPPDLGAVQIKLERAANTPAHIEISVERPEALALLMRDQPALHTALDRAGVPAEGRTLSFQLSNSDRQATQDRGGSDTRAMPGGSGSGRQGGAEPEAGRAARQLRVAAAIRRLSTGLDITA